MDSAKRARNIIVCILLLLSLVQWRGETAAAQEDEQPLQRQTTIVIDFTEYEWWLMRWTDNFFVCQLFVEHDGLPSAEEVLANCGQEVYDQWIATPPCKTADKGEPTFNCTGLYFYFVASKPSQRTLVIDLPPPAVWLTLSGCTLSPPLNLCENLPKLLLTGEEPLPNERITALHAIVGDKMFDCSGEVCEVPLEPTSLGGVLVEFWADSSFGDSSQHFSANVRVLDTGVSQTPGRSGWYVDVLSSQWRGGQVESCAQIWQTFPPVGGPPTWLSTPSEDNLLATGKPNHYLAGRLIFQGLVDASECPTNGLLANGYANACGIKKARPMVDLWQNQFDPRILAVARETGLPAQLMKNLFAQESQFWPGVFRVAREYGLGQITDMGADTVLLWNNAFFDQFCPLVLDQGTCRRGYLRLKEDQRSILRGALAVQANADCANCPTGIDLTNADFSVMLFAQGLLANCDQVGQTIYNATLSSPDEVSSYEDLWRFTLANYHAGPGCLAYAIHTTWSFGDELDWEHVSQQFTEACQSALAYVDLITR